MTNRSCSRNHFKPASHVVSFRPAYDTTQPKVSFSLCNDCTEEYRRNRAEMKAKQQALTIREIK